jgi:hypothetical protein
MNFSVMYMQFKILLIKLTETVAVITSATFTVSIFPSGDDVDCRDAFRWNVL